MKVTYKLEYSNIKPNYLHTGCWKYIGETFSGPYQGSLKCSYFWNFNAASGIYYKVKKSYDQKIKVALFINFKNLKK